MYRVIESEEYQKWFRKLSLKEQTHIQARIARIQNDGHFGNVRKLDKNLAELKWRNGRRIYFTITYDEQGNIVLLLLGGNKNSQGRDIKRAKKLLQDED